MVRWIAIIAVLAATAAEAQTVCRPDALGNSACNTVIAPPPPRPPFRSLGRRPEPVLPPAEPAGRPTTFVPARETNRLGSTVTNRPVSGPCRPDRLGNLNCR